MKMSEMSEIDSNNDGEITFDEFSAPTTEKLKGSFKMLDTNNDDVISQEEWDEFLRVHGFEKKSEG
jgi:Ca2+-binding EF-hand superfamily protein